MINITWLRTFCTLIKIGHFTRTAEYLHMTQSGVSQHIRKLEEQLEVGLIIRDGKSFSLSDRGRTLYEESQEILQKLTNLERILVNDPAYSGAVRILSPGSVGLKLYSKLLDFQQKHQELTIEYKFAPNPDIEDAIANGEADIGFMTSKSDQPQLKCHALAKEKLLLVTPSSVRKPDWKSLCELGFIDHPDGSYHARLLLEKNYREFEDVSTFLRRGFSNQISLVLEPVARGLGFTVLPSYAVDFFSRPKLIRTHSLSESVSETIYLCTRRKEVLPKRFSIIVEECKKWL